MVAIVRGDGVGGLGVTVDKKITFRNPYCHIILGWWMGQGSGVGQV